MKVHFKELMFIVYTPLTDVFKFEKDWPCCSALAHRCRETSGSLVLAHLLRDEGNVSMNESW